MGGSDSPVRFFKRLQSVSDALRGCIRIFFTSVVRLPDEQDSFTLYHYSVGGAEAQMEVVAGWRKKGSKLMDGVTGRRRARGGFLFKVQ